MLIGNYKIFIKTYSNFFLFIDIFMLMS